MYDQGNYAPQFRYGPPRPPLPFPQGLLAPLPPVVQPGPNPPVYHHALPPPPPPPPPSLVQQGQLIQVPNPGAINLGLPFVPPPTSVHGSSQVTHPYSNVQQTSQYPSTLTTQNMHHISPVHPPATPLSGPSHPEMIRAPVLPRVLPPPPSQGQILYRTPLHPPLPGGSQGHQHVGPLPSPPPSSFVPVTPVPFSSFVHTPIEDAYPPSMPPPPPPPPPSSPPPIPSSPPPSPPKSFESSSTSALDAASPTSHHSESGLVYEKPTTSVEKLIDVVDTVALPVQSMEDVPVHDDSQNAEGTSFGKMESLAEYGFSTRGEATTDILPPPPKPPAEEVVRKIEVLCQFIAKNGPDFEDMARKREFGNPEFAFLFGGEPGSGAAIAHDYFQWMKRKSLSESKPCNVPGQSNLLPRTLEIKYSPQHCISTDEDASGSQANSDMDMEDDVNKSDKDQEVSQSVEGTSGEPVSLCNEFLVVKEKLHVEKSLTGHITETLPEHDDSPFGMASTKDRCAGMNSDGAVECTLDLSIKKVTSPVLDDLSSSEASPDAGGISHKVVSSPLIQGGSPFRLIQGYASDDSAEDNDDGAFLENVSPVKDLPCTVEVAADMCQDTGTGLDVSVDSRMTEKGVILFNESIVIDPMSIPDSFPESLKVGEASDIPSDALVLSSKADELGTINDGNQISNEPAASRDASEQNSSLHCDVFSTDHQDGKLQNEDAKQRPTHLKVDEFGRLVREGASDSDSDGPRHSVRRGKRGRSRSRSRSPQDRRRRRRSRSPWRRKERWSRSRSLSPKKRRSRSRSPAFRRMGEFGFEKIKRERNCKDFLRGRCKRGGSCRFQHHDSSLHDGARSYRTKQLQHLEAPHDAGKIFSRGEIKNVTTKVSGFEEGMDQDMPAVHITDAPKKEALDGKTEPISPRADVQPINSNEAGQSTSILAGDVGQHEKVQETISQLWEKVEPTVQLLDFEDLKRPAENLPALPLDRSPKQSPTNVLKQNSPGESFHSQPQSAECSVAQLPMDNASASLALPVHENAGHDPQQIDSPNVSHSLPPQISPTVPVVCEPYPAQSTMSQPSSQSPPPQSIASKEFHPPSYPAIGNHFQPSHLPLPQDINTPHVSLPPKDYSLPLAGTSFGSQSAPLERFPPSQAPLQDQHSHFLGPQNPSWTSFQVAPSYGSHPVQFPQNTMHSRNNFAHAMMEPYQFEEHAHSLVHSQSFLPMEGPQRPPLQLADFRPKPLPVDPMQEHHLGGPSFIREEHFTHSVLPERKLFHPAPQQDYYLHPRPQLRDEQHFPLPVRDDVQNIEAPPNQRFNSQFQLPGFTTSTSIFPDNVHSHNVPFPRESPAKLVQSFSKEDFGTMSRQLPYGFQPSGTDGFSSHFSAPVKVDSSRYSSSLLENKQALLSSVGGSKISSTTHYNPFASTFEQPPGGSKFNSSVFRHEIDTNYRSKYESSFGLSHVPTDGQGVVGLGSRQMASPPDSGRPGGQILPRSGDSSLAVALGQLNDRAHPREAPAESFPGARSQYARESIAGNQYDPLFDSIEPSSSTLRKFVHVQERDLNSDVSRAVDVVSRLTGSHRPLDIEENNKRKEVAAAAVTVSPENDEFGETAEVDAVENGSPQTGEGKNWSPGSQNVATGDVEIDQVRSPGKSKKTKDSRSMKLFKSAIADFVKEVLKPSWRQGNMSKEAFKTIVKKTVDKVSGAMKNHQIPKSQAKINQYVESSQRKLTKLVMGYVDKGFQQKLEIVAMVAMSCHFIRWFLKLSWANALKKI
ncbi:hypothetical protein NE237_021232 [Protea cynaroides]|uniref:C3H1-type domain-containing protein n=1 Tax=Protea cynaroides TaxID=273540 RepID=A0A9Q0K3C1_9MAGN|nr:hypothetical protein NE237_021232 [Protea cynaroides]